MIQSNFTKNLYLNAEKSPNLPQISIILALSSFLALAGTFSSCVPVTSGVPLGSILGPLFFLFYVNDILSTTTAISLFADDAKCSKAVCNQDDCVAFQHDLNLLTSWSNEWGLSFNSNKCEILRMSRKKRSLLDSPKDNPYTINNHPLALVSSSKDLGVLVNNKLT